MTRFFFKINTEDRFMSLLLDKGENAHEILFGV